ncbi:MAG TPA: hypothetical protein ENK07_04620 [Bacteroidetes bacterium]|nr:hypothetical protein [Bacteroidota bacterium]
MKHWLGGLTVVLLAVALLLGCAGTSKMNVFEEPVSDQTGIVIGNVLVESRYFEERPELYRANIDVAVIGEVTENGKKKIHGYWATTDDQGYFFLTNVPIGKYAIKGIRFSTNQGTLLTITNSLRYAGSTYVIDRKETIIFDGSYFPVEPKGRVINMGYNHFVIDQTTRSTGHVDHLQLPRLVNYQVITGEKLNLGPVEEYFIQKYPNSAWVQVLKQAVGKK